MADFGKLQEVTAALANYKLQLQQKLQRASEQNDEEMVLLRDTA